MTSSTSQKRFYQTSTLRFFMSSASDSCVISIGNDYGEVILLSKDKNAMADSV
ncbi:MULTISPECIES: hypothetical protein [unclassified Providencia]|uniref:hypothetical protein n=1 Tax=unclassified Providencia TaxID=2633465 RepID=UPI00234B30F2|nr:MULTISPECIES: hypothetical protein [unclassified Providencia]